MSTDQVYAEAFRVNFAHGPEFGWQCIDCDIEHLNAGTAEEVERAAADHNLTAHGIARQTVPVSGEDQPDPQRKAWADDPLWGLDPLIKRYVQILVAGGVETFESCQGGPGHCSFDPMVRFHGDMSAGWRALGVVLDHGLPVLELMREWPVVAGEPRGPYWRLTFRHGDPGPAMTFEEICESQKAALPHD